MNSEYPSPAFIVTVSVPSICANNRGNVSVTLHGGTFVKLLLPWRQLLVAMRYVCCYTTSVTANNMKHSGVHVMTLYIFVHVLGGVS
jgi:hypothetical protein